MFRLYLGLFLFLGLISLSCIEQQGEKVDDKSDLSNDTLDIIKEVIDIPKLQNFLHRELENRTPLLILRNNVIKGCCSIKSNTTDIKFVSREQVLTKEGVNKDKNLSILDVDPYLEVKQLEFSNQRKRVDIKLIYPIEGITIMANLRKTSEWEIISSEISEH